MIGFFPDPYPDELLYSACARFNDRMRYPNATTTAKNLFGSGRASAVVDLPGRLNHFLKVLPPNHTFSADFLIDHHTLAPLYIPFLPSERAKRLRHDMKTDGDGKYIKGVIGATASGIKALKWLRFCPSCEREDNTRFGERYWHRVHQVFGVEFCPIHAIFLEDSTALKHYSPNPSKFFSANNSISTLQPRAFDSSNCDHIILLKLAKDIAWLLNWREHSSDLRFLHERYYNLLLKQGLAFYNGKIKTPALVERLMNFYSPTLLKRLKSEIKNPHENWVFRAVHPDTTEITQHPIRHLLIINYLGHTAEEFFTSSYIFKPFGDGPWPCLNRASGHFGQLLITKYQLTDNRVKKKRGRPAGKFICKCGFIYSRVGPDESEKDRFRTDSIQAFGHVWENVLRKLWLDTTTSLREAGQRLGVSDLTVVRYAIRFDLPMNRHGYRKVGPYALTRYKNYKRSLQDAFVHYRKDWLSVLKANPGAGRKHLGEIAYSTFSWLRQNDPEWLESHLPPRRRNYPTYPRLDWKKIDRELSAAVRVSIERIKHREGKPVRASLSVVARDLGRRSHLERQLAKLPRTTKALMEGLEGPEEFSMRKIENAESCYRKEGICPARYQLIHRANLKNAVGRTTQIQNAVTAALGRLSKRFG
jgi:Tn7-like transposition protein D/TniQ protein